MNTNNPKSKAPLATGSRGPGTAANVPVVPAKKHHNRRLCRTSEYQPPGSKVVGLSKDNQPSKIVWEIPYALQKGPYEQLCARFPGIAFVQTGFDSHDHPIAHTSYRIVWENVMKQIKPGSKVADISGNPQYNEDFCRSQAGRKEPITIDTFCKVESPKDSVRAKTRWGPKVAKDGRVRWEEESLYNMYRFPRNRLRFETYDVFLMNQCLYYYDKAEINKLLQLNKESVLHATIHKLPGQKGTINCGEQAYEKDPVSGKVHQWNVETGEDYNHPDPAPWFKGFSYADEYGAIAWTINKGCEDTYRLTITSTDPVLVPEANWLGGRIVIRRAQEVGVGCEPIVAEDPPPAYPVEEVVFRTRDLLPKSIIDKSVTVKVTHPEVMKELKFYMINKPRNHKTLQDLTSKAHRVVGNNHLVGGRVKVDISPENLTKHIFAAWMAGSGLEEQLFKAVFTSSSSIGSVNRNLSGRSAVLGRDNLAKQACKYALTVSHIARSKDPVHQVLAQIDELL